MRNAVADGPMQGSLKALTHGTILYFIEQQHDFAVVITHAISVDVIAAA